jgi:protein SCO1/2
VTGLAGAASYGGGVTRRPRLAALLGAAAVALSACGGGAAAGTGAASSAHDHAAPASVSSTAKGPYDGLNLPQPYQRPTFTLTDTSGAPFDFGAATKGKPTLLFFGYTTCPDVCPTTLADIAVALRTVDRSLAGRVQVVFVTTDPGHDTQPVLRQYLDRFDADLPLTFTGLTGSQHDIDQAQLAAGVPVAQDEGHTHSALLLLYGHDDQAHVAYDAGNSGRDIAHDLGIVASAS